MWCVTSSTPTDNSLDGSTSLRLAARMSSTSTVNGVAQNGGVAATSSGPSADSDSAADATDFEAYCNGATGASSGGAVAASSGAGGGRHGHENRFSPSSVVVDQRQRASVMSASSTHNINRSSTFGLFADEADYGGIASSTTQQNDTVTSLYCPPLIGKTEPTILGGGGHPHHLYRPNGLVCHPTPDGGSAPSLLVDQKFNIDDRLTVDGLCPPTSTRGPPMHAVGYGSGSVRAAIRSYHCRLCKKEFENKSDMQRHSKERHRAEEKHHKCSLCLKSFPTSQQLAQHSLVHTNVRKYPCRYCDKSFKQLSHVQQHQRIHTGDRPYKCVVDGCEKAFRQLSSLQQHLKGHNIPMPKSYCLQRSVSNSSDVIDRIKKMSPLARPNDLTCQVCEKLCENEERFFRHIHKYHPDYWRVFASGRPLTDYIEPPPQQQQQQQQQRRYGQRREKRFSCSICGKAFAHETGYAKHMASHANGLSFGSGGLGRHGSIDQSDCGAGGCLLNGSPKDYLSLRRSSAAVDSKLFPRFDDHHDPTSSSFFAPHRRHHSLLEISSGADDVSKKAGRLFRPALSTDCAPMDLVDPLMQRYSGLFGGGDAASIKYERPSKMTALDQQLQDGGGSPVSCGSRSDGSGGLGVGGLSPKNAAALQQINGGVGTTSAGSPLTPMMMNGMVYGSSAGSGVVGAGSSLFPVAPTPFGCGDIEAAAAGAASDVMSSYHRRNGAMDVDDVRHHFRYKFPTPYHASDFPALRQSSSHHHHQHHQQAQQQQSTSGQQSQQSSPIFYRQGSTDIGSSSGRQTSPPSPVDSSYRAPSTHHRSYFSSASPYLGQAGVMPPPPHMSSAMAHQGGSYVDAASRYDGALGSLNSYLQLHLARSLPVFR